MYVLFLSKFCRHEQARANCRRLFWLVEIRFMSFFRGSFVYLRRKKIWLHERRYNADIDNGMTWTCKSYVLCWQTSCKIKSVMFAKTAFMVVEIWWFTHLSVAILTHRVSSNASCSIHPVHGDKGHNLSMYQWILLKSHFKTRSVFLRWNIVNVKVCWKMTIFIEQNCFCDVDSILLYNYIYLSSSRNP